MLPTKAPRQEGSEVVTDGFRVTVQPRFVPEQSDPGAGKYFFAYRIRIANEGLEQAKLLSRRWVIVDADGERHEVEGEGVVGEQPELTPGGQFVYTSFCPLGTHWGTMEGAYTMQVVRGPRTGETFDIRIGRFLLVGPRPKP